MTTPEKVEKIVLLMSPIVTEEGPASERAAKLREVARLATSAAADLHAGRRVVLTVPGDAGELSANRVKRLAHSRGGNHVISSLCSRWRSTTCLIAKSERLAPFTGKVQLSFVIRRGRVLDADALSFGSMLCKSVTDGLVDSGLLKDDSLHYVESGTVTQETGGCFRDRPEVLIMVEELCR